MWNPINWLLCLCGSTKDDDALPLDCVPHPVVPTTVAQPALSPKPRLTKEAALLDANMFPHIMDMIWSYAPDDSLMRLRCVSSEFKERADSLLMDHIFYSEYERLHSIQSKHLLDRHLLAIFVLTTTGHRLPALYPFSSGDNTAYLDQLFAQVQVLDCVKGWGEYRFDGILPPSLHPSILRTSASSLAPIAVGCVPPRSAHVHFHQKNDTNVCFGFSRAARKLVIHFLDGDLQRLDDFCPVDVKVDDINHPESRFNLEEIVIISESPSLVRSESCDNTDDEDNNSADDMDMENGTDSDSSDSEDDHCTDDEDDSVTIASITWALCMTVNYITALSGKQANTNLKITFVDFPVELHQLLVSHRSDICTPVNAVEEASDCEAVLDSIMFVNSETYRKEVGEDMWRLETDRSTFDKLVGREAASRYL